MNALWVKRATSIIVKRLNVLPTVTYYIFSNPQNKVIYISVFYSFAKKIIWLWLVINNYLVKQLYNNTSNIVYEY